MHLNQNNPRLRLPVTLVYTNSGLKVLNLSLELRVGYDHELNAVRVCLGSSRVQQIERPQHVARQPGQAAEWRQVELPIFVVQRGE